MPRIGVLYSDGSLNIISPRRGEQQALAEARDVVARANLAEKQQHHAKVVSIDITEMDIVPVG